MSSVLALTLIVRHPETDAATALIAGQPLPDWAEGLVHPDDLTEPEPEPVADTGPVETESAEGSDADATLPEIVPGEDDIPEPVTEPAPAKRARRGNN